MRSELVIQAAQSVENRFLLVHVASKLTRAFHRPTKDRLPDTINNGLAGLGEGRNQVLNRWRLEGELEDGKVPPDYKIVGYEITGPPPQFNTPHFDTAQDVATAFVSGEINTAQASELLAGFTSISIGMPYFPAESA